MLLSYKYRLYPNKRQRVALDRNLEIHRQVYNAALEERKKAYHRAGPRVSVGYRAQANQLKNIREFDQDFAWANFSSLQQTLRRVQKSYDGFFRRVEKGQKAGFPRFKGRHWFKSVAYVYGDGCRIQAGRLAVQRIGVIRMFQHRPIPDDAKIKQVVLKRDKVGNWFAVFQIELPDPVPTEEPVILRSVGIDMGLASFLALSTGELIDNPRWYRQGEAKLAKLQKMRSRCKRRSRRYYELSRQIRVHHARTADRRLDFQHKLSAQLVSQYDVIFVEKLNTNGLCRSHVAKSMHDAAWSQFLFLLQYKAERAGGARPEVDARGTSQTCPACGAEVRKELSERVHVCFSCGYVAPRDVAAAQVVELRGATGWTDPLRKVILSWGEVAGSRSLQ